MVNYVKKVLVDVPPQSPLLFLIPENEPFHVTLNACGQPAQIFTAELHEHLVNSALPEKSKPDRVAVLVAVALLGWNLKF